MSDPLDEAIARAERLLDSTLLDAEEREFLQDALWYDKEVRDGARQRVVVLN